MPREWTERMVFLTGRSARYRHVFGSPEGKQVLRDILRFCGINADPHVPGDPFTSAYNNGRQRVARHIIGVMETDEVKAMRIAQREAEDASG